MFRGIFARNSNALFRYRGLSLKGLRPRHNSTNTKGESGAGEGSIENSNFIHPKWGKFMFGGLVAGTLFGYGYLGMPDEKDKNQGASGI